MHLARKRRWLSYSVRTLLLAVTVFCVWLGWQVSIVRDRKAMLQRIDAAGGNGTWRDRSGGKHLMWHRRKLGDRFIPRITVPSSWTDEQITEITQLFPEAKVRRQAVYSPSDAENPFD